MRRRNHQTPALADPTGDMRRLRQKYRDRLLTLLTILLILTIFVFAPLQAVDVFIFRGFAIAILLPIAGSGSGASKRAAKDKDEPKKAAKPARAPARAKKAG